MVKLFLFTLGIVKATRHESSVCTAEDLLKIGGYERRNGETLCSDRGIEQVVGGMMRTNVSRLKSPGRVSFGKVFVSKSFCFCGKNQYYIVLILQRLKQYFFLLGALYYCYLFYTI